MITENARVEADLSTGRRTVNRLVWGVERAGNGGKANRALPGAGRPRHRNRALPSSTCSRIRRPTLSASAMMLSSSIVSTLPLRMTNWPSTITDSMSDG